MPWTGLTAPSIAFKTSTTALSLRMVFWSIVRKFWWEKEVANGENIFRCAYHVHWRYHKSPYKSPEPFFVCKLPEVPWQSWSRAGGLGRWGQMYQGYSGSQRTACCLWPPGGSSGHTRCSSGRCSMLPCRKDQCLSWKILNTAGFSNYKSSNYTTVVLKIEKLQRISITSISISLLYFRRHTLDQWFWGFLCRDDQWRWQTRPLRETLGWGCGWTGAHSASPGSDWKQGETNQLPLLTKIDKQPEHPVLIRGTSSCKRTIQGCDQKQ